jgi:3-oxoacyl-[acyl-carrier protein] reductase
LEKTVLGQAKAERTKGALAVAGGHHVFQGGTYERSKKESAMGKLDNRVSIVTGGARGIGFGTALRLAQEGSIVAIVDLDADAAKSAAQRLRDQGFVATGCVANVTNPGEIEAAIEKISKQYGRIDALINIAGIWNTEPFERISFEEWRRIFDVNVDGVFRACQCAYRIMMAAGYGRIVNIATGAVATGRPGPKVANMELPPM